MTGEAAQEEQLFEDRRDRIRARYLKPYGSRPASSARGLHHTALVSSDVERTVRFYHELLEFPLTELIENRDYPGSSHFFFDIGNANLLAFFEFPASRSAHTGRSSAGCTMSRSASRRPAGHTCEPSCSPSASS